MTKLAVQAAPSMVEWLSVPPEQVGAVWMKLKPMIERGLSSGQGSDTTVDHMLLAVLQGTSMLWVAMQEDDPVAGVILRQMETDTGKKLWIDMLAGKDQGLWADQLEILVGDYARLTGSRGIECSCRPGLARILERRGWLKKSIIMEWS